MTIDEIKNLTPTQAARRAEQMQRKLDQLRGCIMRSQREADEINYQLGYMRGLHGEAIEERSRKQS